MDTEQEQLEARAEHFTEVASETGRHVRNVYITFLLLCTYIGVTIGSTTHEQLLRVDPVTLPILNVGLPIVGFYIFIPWVLVILHFNLLLQLYFLSRVLRRADEAIYMIKAPQSRDELRDTLFPFHFSHLLAGRQHGKGLRFLLTLIVWVTVMLVPLLLLVWAQVQFLPYHDEMITWIQRAALVTDFAILWILWPMSMSPKGALISWWRCLLTAPPRTLWVLMIGLWMGMLAVLRKRPMSQLNAKWKSVRPSCHMRGAMTLLTSTLVLIPFSLLIAVLPDKSMERWLLENEGIPQTWIMQVPDGTAKEDWKRNPMLRLTYRLFEADGALFRRNLVLVGKVLVAGNPTDETLEALLGGNSEEQEQAFRKVRGIENLAGRDFRYANFSHSYLVKANLNKAELDGAHLERAEFRGANLNGASLKGAKLSKARFKEANLASAQLQKASLISAELQGASLTSANLQGADLRSTNLQGANLNSAELKSANLERAQLQGAELIKAKLHGTNLKSAKLQGAVLNSAQLERANLKQAQLNEASLTGANLQGANLNSAELKSANLERANLRRADLSGAHLQGAGLSSAQLQHAYLNRAQLQDADLRWANLQDASLNLANLQGANLYYARLKGANLPYTKLQEANFSHAQLDGANLLQAELQEASLKSSTIQGAILSEAQLQGTNLENAKLKGASLYKAHLQLANLKKAQLQGTNLMSANLQWAELESTQLQGANLESAQLQGANLSSAQLQGAYLYNTQLQGTNLTDANLTLAVLLKLGRGEFTQMDYAKLENVLDSRIIDKQLKSKILKIANNDIGRADNLAFGSNTHHALCEVMDPSKECLTFRQAEQFIKEWVELLASLACPNSYISERVAIQAAPLFSWATSYEPEIDKLLKHKAYMLASRLLSPDCKGGTELPDSLRKRLQEVLKYKGQN